MGVGDILKHVGQVVGEDHSVPVEEGAVTGLAHPGGKKTTQWISLTSNMMVQSDLCPQLGSNPGLISLKTNSLPTRQKN